MYEERSLGIYEPAPGEEQEEDMPTKGTARLWGGYLAAHARRQLAFGEFSGGGSSGSVS